MFIFHGEVNQIFSHVKQKVKLQLIQQIQKLVGNRYDNVDYLEKLGVEKLEEILQVSIFFVSSIPDSYINIYIVSREMSLILVVENRVEFRPKKKHCSHFLAILPSQIQCHFKFS